MAAGPSLSLWDFKESPQSARGHSTAGWLRSISPHSRSTSSCRPDKSPRNRLRYAALSSVSHEELSSDAHPLRDLQAIASADGESAAEENPPSSCHPRLTASSRKHPNATPRVRLASDSILVAPSPAALQRLDMPWNHGSASETWIQHVALPDSDSTSSLSTPCLTPPSSGKNTPAMAARITDDLRRFSSDCDLTDTQAQAMDGRDLNDFSSMHSLEEPWQEGDFWRWDRNREKWVHEEDDGTLIECPDELD